MPRQIFPALFIRGLTSEMLRAVWGNVPTVSFFTIDVFAQCALYIHTDIYIYVQFISNIRMHFLCTVFAIPKVGFAS